jgi:hypothetical protein
MSTKNALQLVFLAWLPAIALLAVDEPSLRWLSVVLFAVGFSALLAWFLTNKSVKKQPRDHS